MNVHISLAAEPIFHLGPLVITNSMLVSWLLTAGLILFARLVTKKISLVPQSLQNLAEIVIAGLFNFMESVAGERTREFFPLISTFFIFILLGNWTELLPGIGTIGFHTHQHGQEIFVPLFRGVTADLNTTFALALISVVTLHYLSFKHLGTAKYITFRFLNPIGILESMADFAKVLSFSFRLFGNIFAGEVLLTVVTFLMPLVVPLPFLGLEIFVGFIQALIFTMLSLVFFSTAVETD